MKLYAISKLVIYTFTPRYNVASKAFLKAKYSVLCKEFQRSLKFHFSQWKIHLSQLIFIDKYLKFKEIEYFIRHINFKMWLSLFYANFLYYQQWNSNWDIAFFNSSLDLKLGFLNVGFRLYFKFFPYSQKDWKLGFVNITLVGLLNFFEFMKEMDYWDFWMLT